MMADVCDADQLQTGSQRMGLYYSLLQISSKITGGLGIFIGFSFLAYFGFDPSLGDANPEDAVERLRLIIVILPVIAYCIVIGLMWKYPITRERQREIRSMIHQPSSRYSGKR
jgi:Na+/melibiose symporter-like transporter